MSDDERFDAIYAAACAQYPDGVVVADGERLYGFHKRLNGRLVLVHPAFAILLQRGLPTVTAAELLKQQANTNGGAE